MLSSSTPFFITVKILPDEGTLTSKLESEMTLLRRHIEMLSVVAKEEPIGIINLAERMDLPQHKVRYSLRILENEGVLRPTPRGAVTSGNLGVFAKRVEEMLERMNRDAERIRDLVKDL